MSTVKSNRRLLFAFIAAMLLTFVMDVAPGSLLSDRARAQTTKAKASARRRRVRRRRILLGAPAAPPTIAVPEAVHDGAAPARPSAPNVSAAADAPPPSPAPTPKRSIVSGGVLNGKALSKPQPAYPPIAKAAHASGTVVVQVLVDETGKVVSARAVSGHPLLQQAAVQAAYQARFAPTKLSGQPVKVTGVIQYNFVAQ